MAAVDVAPYPPRAHGVVAALLDQLQGRGQLVASLPELESLSGLTALAVKRQMERLADRVVRLPGRPSCFLIVPPEHRGRGAPPVAYWLADYCRLRQKPYYVCLLSAAALHGSAQQAVQLTQVLTTTPTRALIAGSVHVEFHVKERLADTPLTSIKGLAAPLAVSSPEATALDLLAFQHCVGGVARAANVIAGLLPAMTVNGWRRALPFSRVVVRQRTGYVLEALGARRFANLVQASLPSKLRSVLLQSATPSLGTGGQLPWQVDDNVGLQGELN